MIWDWLVERTGKYCSIRRIEYPEFQTGIFGRMESAPCLVGKTCWRMNVKKRGLVPLSHQSLKSAVNCGVLLRAANLPLLCLLGKTRIMEILKVMTT